MISKRMNPSRSMLLTAVRMVRRSLVTPLTAAEREKTHPAAGRDGKKSAGFGRNARGGKGRNAEKSVPPAKSNRAAKKAARGHAPKRKSNRKNAG